MPIRIRLALWCSGILGAALLVFTVALYGFMAQHLDSMVARAIADRVDLLVSAVQSANSAGDSSESLVVPPLDAFESPEIYVQILAVNGTALRRSANLAGQAIPVPQGSLRQGEFPVSLDDTRMKTLIVPVTIGAKTVAWVQVAASYRQRDAVLDRLRWGLAGGWLGAVALVGVLSATLAGRALAPLSEMMETARAIALSRGFSRRLNVPSQSDEMGELAQTFNEMLASLEEAYSAQQRFTADASHELRAPLTAIRGNLDLLDRIKDMPAEERRQTLAQVRREVERLSRLVNDLLALARADAGQPLQVRPVELDAVLVEAHRQALSIADGLNLRLTHVEPAVVQGDEDRLRQLLLILLDNAVRYTPQGGTVSLAMEHEPPWVAITVEDTGMGIAPEDVPHIFQRFWRADRARSRDSGGTGLGLSIAKWIVDQHGGEVLVDSAPGKGSRFTVRLLSSS